MSILDQQGLASLWPLRGFCPKGNILQRGGGGREAEGGRRRAGGGRAAWRGVIGMLLGILRRWPIPLRKAENYTFSHCGERERGGKS